MGRLVMTSWNVRFWAIAALLLAGLAVACGNKCEELATERSKCGTGQGGGGDEEEIQDDCSDAEDKCAGCLLDSNEDLCDPRGELAALTACNSECQDITP